VLGGGYLFFSHYLLLTFTSVYFSDILGVNRIKIFAYNELRKVTDGFSIANKIGEGGFGSVYKVISHLQYLLYVD
jgi:hypothetical protein